MLRKCAASLSLIAVMATGAVAQAPFKETFTLTSATSTDFWTYMGEFTGQTNYALTGAGGTYNNPTAFEVWCIDPLDGISVGHGDSAWVTPLWKLPGAQTDFTHSFAGITADNNEIHFVTAAYLASQMPHANSGVCDIPNPDACADDYQYAIWQELGYSRTDAGASTAQWSNAAQLIANVTAAQINSVDLADWGIINNYEKSSSNVVYQEFLYCKVTPAGSCDGGGHILDYVPEPATVSLVALGLVGLSGGSIRRRRRKA